MKEGQQIPQVALPVRTDDGWTSIDTYAFCRGKNVVIFGLPGAFTPTCSSSHLPRYDELASLFYRLGIDAIVCVSVNDTFVMNAWAQDQKVKHVIMWPDGNGEFSKAMGMLEDKRQIGFGDRSWRYSMLVRDGVIEKMFVEPKVEGDPYQVSDADTMLKYLQPDVEIPKPILLYIRPGCPFCKRAEAALDEAGLNYQTEVVGQDITPYGLEAVAGKRSTPQVFVGGKHIGGSDELLKWLAERG